MTFPVIVIFPVFQVVLFVIGNQVVHCETVMSSNKVYARSRLAVVILIQVGASGKTLCKFSQHTVGAAPVVAKTISVFPIPFSPSRRKFSHLVAAFADIPRFGNQ